LLLALQISGICINYKVKIPYEMLKNRKCSNIGGEVVSGAVTHANDFKQNLIKIIFTSKIPYEMLKNRKYLNIGGEVVSEAVTHANDFKQNPIKKCFTREKGQNPL
jgi:hypothetical protein